MPCGQFLSINDEEANFPSASVIDDAGEANEATSADSSNSSASKFITVAEISPLPKNISSSQRRWPSAKATLLTSSPHKKRVKEQFEIQKSSVKKCTQKRIETNQIKASRHHTIALCVVRNMKKIGFSAINVKTRHIKLVLT